jgi:hypothetical protein
MSQIILKKSNVSAKVPVVSDLAYGELALNYADGILYYRTSADAISGIKVSYSNLTGTVPTWNQNTAGNAGTVTNGVYLTTAQTITNKRIQPRVQPVTVTTSTQTWNSDNYDQINFTLSTATTTIQLDSGTPVDGQKIMFCIKDDGTARTFALTSSGTNCFRNVGTSITLSSTSTTATKLTYVGCVYNSSGTGTWDIVAFGQEA